MIVHIIHLFIVRIVVGHAAQGLLGQPEVVEPVLEDYAGMVQTVFQYLVACLQLCWGKRNLCQIVLPLVRIVLQRVSGIVNRILPCLGLQDRVPLLVGQFDECLRITDPAHDSLVDALPVVNVLTLSPQLLERDFTLLDSRRTVEIPRAALLTAVVLPADISKAVTSHIASVVLLPGVVLSLLLASLFLLLPLQCCDDTVNRRIALFLRALRKVLERVLELYGICIRGQLVQYLRPFGQLFVVLAVLVEQPDGFTVTASGITETLLCPVEVAEMEQQHSFFDTAPCGFPVPLFVGVDGGKRVPVGEIDVAHGIIHLIEILLVVV